MITKSNYKFSILMTAVLAVTAIALSAHAADLSDKEKQFLAGYEKIHIALAADDLVTAQSAARELGDEGGDIIKAGTLKDARAVFEKLSSRAKTLVAGQSGYYVVHCPILQKDWVQTSDKIANPYAGKEMATCGEIKK
ncbi:MAG TPA: hypothetical protein VN921_01830 [Chthoniobacterales bacterium]|nr:hypothetical protein [Chthoniobacterales bacterium]